MRWGAWAATCSSQCGAAELDRSRAYNQSNARLAWGGPTLSAAVRLHVLHRAVALLRDDATSRGGGARLEEEGGEETLARASSYASSRAGSVPPPRPHAPPALASVLPQRRQRLLSPSHWPGVGADLPLGLPSRALACPPRLRRRLTQVCSPPKLGRWPGATVLDDAAPHSISSPPEPHQ